MLAQEKIFPERLPKGFHGALRQSSRARRFAVQTNQDCQLQNQSVRLNAWKRHKSDRQVELINRVMVTNPVRTSSENPEWIKSTFLYQQRALQHKREKDHKHYNILGEEKTAERTDFRRTIFPVFDRTPLKFDWPAPNLEQKFAVTSKVGFYPNGGLSDIRHASHSHYETRRQVTPKIGTTETRDFSMGKTAIKIGHDRLIDTNSVL